MGTDRNLTYGIWTSLTMTTNRIVQQITKLKRETYSIELNHTRDVTCVKRRVDIQLKTVHTGTNNLFIYRCVGSDTIKVWLHWEWEFRYWSMIWFFYSIFCTLRRVPRFRIIFGMLLNLYSLTMYIDEATAAVVLFSSPDYQRMCFIVYTSYQCCMVIK